MSKPFASVDLQKVTEKRRKYCDGKGLDSTDLDQPRKRPPARVYRSSNCHSSDSGEKKVSFVFFNKDKDAF